jgi:hypothetical protein
MPSERRSAASRTNGAKSRGPITPEGKANSARNSLKHGVLARTLVLDSESAQRFDTLLAGLTAELQPETGIELAFVESMAVARWRQMRIWVLEKSGFDHEIRKQDPANAAEDTPTRAALAFRTLCDRSNSLELMNRYEVRFDRQYSRALRQFYEAKSRRKRSFAE